MEYRRADDVVTSIERFWALGDEREIEIELIEWVETRSSVAAVTRWTASGPSRGFQGLEVAVYRVADGRIAEALFLPDFSFVDISSALGWDETRRE